MVPPLLSQGVLQQARVGPAERNREKLYAYAYDMIKRTTHAKSQNQKKSGPQDTDAKKIYPRIHREIQDCPVHEGLTASAAR